MANKKLKHAKNTQGNFFVDTTCIDCGTCYWIAPDTFQRYEGEQSIVYQQPDEKKRYDSYRALYSCPTNSIGVESRDEIASEVIENLPYEIAPNIFHTGYHSPKSFGAASYFIKNKNGNILVDSPRFNKKLANKIRGMGGVKHQLLSHKDDIADTDLFHEEFNSTRFIHKDDAQKTSHYERFFEGEEVKEIFPGMLMIPVPGHTKGSVCYLYQEKYLFTGDHLAFSKKLNHLYAFKTACWYDFDKQIESVERLLNYSFEFVLPGHGAPYKSNTDRMKKQLETCIEWMKND
jgi:glyoxylase-like metal-dependent hydrolase (beta-lactamase superfamily II)/ferredoxin